MTSLSSSTFRLPGLGSPARCDLRPRPDPASPSMSKPSPAISRASRSTHLTVRVNPQSRLGVDSRSPGASHMELRRHRLSDDAEHSPASVAANPAAYPPAENVRGSEESGATRKAFLARGDLSRRR